MNEFYVHYWYGPNEDDVRFIAEVATLAEARAIAMQCPPDETAKICDRFGVSYPVTA